MSDDRPTGPLGRLGDRWERRRAEARAAEAKLTAQADARSLARLRKVWARERERLAKAPVEHVRHTAELRLPVPADVVWRTVVDPAGPQLASYGTPLAAGTLPGPPADAVGGRTFEVLVGPDGVSTSLEEVVHVEPGRRITRRLLHHPRRALDGWWVEPDGDGCLLRRFIDTDAARDCAWQTRQVAEAEVRRSLWFVARALAGPAVAPDPEPPFARVMSDTVRRRTEEFERIARGPRVEVEAVFSVTLAAEVHAAWLAVCTATSPVVEHADAEAWWLPLARDGAGPPAVPGPPVLVGAISRHPLGALTLLPYEIVAAEPGVALHTRGIEPFGVVATVELTQVAGGTRVDVRLREEVLPGATTRSHRMLLARAYTAARRIERHAVSGPRPPLDDVWFP